MTHTEIHLFCTVARVARHSACMGPTTSHPLVIGVVSRNAKQGKWHSTSVLGRCCRRGACDTALVPRFRSHEQAGERSIRRTLNVWTRDSMLRNQSSECREGRNACFTMLPSSDSSNLSPSTAWENDGPPGLVQAHAARDVSLLEIHIARRRGTGTDRHRKSPTLALHNMLTVSFESLQQLSIATLCTIAIFFSISIFLVVYEGLRWAARIPGFRGPHGLPIVGNMWQIYGKDAPLQYREWSRQYGPVYQIQLGNIPILVINTASAAKALLTQNSHATASRPEFYTFHKASSLATTLRSIDLDH